MTRGLSTSRVLHGEHLALVIEGWSGFNEGFVLHHGQIDETILYVIWLVKQERKKLGQVVIGRDGGVLGPLDVH